MLPLLPLVFSLISALSEPQQTTIIFAGDAMQHQRQIDAAHRSDGTYNYDGVFDPIKDYITSADYAVVNLETPVAGGRYSGYPMFNAPDAWLDALTDAGFDLMLTANNHVLDRRDQGVKATNKALDSRCIPHLGSYANATERDRILPLVKDINGIKVGFLNYTYGTNGIKIQGDVVVDYIDREQIKKDIAATRAAGAEILVVAMHWGVEYVLLPNKSQKDLADFLVKQGVDLVIGGHPHVIQPMEMRANPVTGGKSLVVYSMGNLVSNMTTTDTRGGALVAAYLSRDNTGKACVDSAAYRLVYVNPPSPTNPQYQVVPIDANTSVSTVVPVFHDKCRGFLSNALRIFDGHNVDVPRYRP